MAEKRLPLLLSVHKQSWDFPKYSHSIQVPGIAKKAVIPAKVGIGLLNSTKFLLSQE